jgi:enamine deaminase RidA (YjgF/YER057c/UK114 family)
MPTGTRWGAWLFLSGQTPVHLETGRLIRTPWDLPREGQKATVTGFEFMDSRVGPVKAQTWMIYSNLAQILGQQGSSLEQVVRQRIYLRDVNDSAAVEEVVLQFFPGAKPATKVQGIPSHELQEGLRIQIEIIALVEGHGLAKEPISVPELDGMTAPYPLAVKAGNLLFTSGIMGTTLDTGRGATKLEDLGADVAEVSTGQVLTDATAEVTKAQFWLMFQHLKRILESQGAPFGNLLRNNRFARRRMDDLGYVHPLQAKLFGEPHNWPAATGFSVRNLHVRDDVQVLSDSIALLPGEHRKQVGLPSDRLVATGIAMWTTGGPFWLVSGELGVDPREHKVINSLGDLDDEGRWLALGRVHEGQAVIAQAWYIYRKLERLAKEGGANLSSVVQQNIYLRDLAQYPAVERVAHIAYDGEMPPTTVIPVDGIGTSDDLLLEIEVIAVAE